MTRILLAGAAAFITMTGAALAQSAAQTTTQETTIEQPATAPVAVPPATVSSSETSGSAVHSDGDQTATRGTSFTDSTGARTETTVTNTSYPLTGMITTTKKSTSVVNGIATETVTTTHTYPPSAMIPPQVSTATRTYVAGTK